MSLPSGPYNHAEHEKNILDWWLSKQVYKPEYNPETDSIMSLEEMKNDPREPWALICPPPNAYARPHIGNISGYAYQDAIARFARMQGKKVLVLPGKDHAGLEGEGVFVRDVLEKQGRLKFDMNREDFYAEMMEFFHKNMDIARKDEREIGLSADFDRDTFTLDPDIVKTVLDTFVEMFNEGKIYKGVRLVNWDPKARTAVADNQTLYKDSVTPFFYFKYAFTEPEQEAIAIKNQFLSQKLCKFRLDASTSSNHGQDRFNNLFTCQGFPVNPLGYKFKRFGGKHYRKSNDIDYLNDRNALPDSEEFEGVPIGIEMKISSNILGEKYHEATQLNKLHLVVINPEKMDMLDELIKKEFFDNSKIFPGYHIIRFDEYQEDKFYTNGFILGTVRPETKFGDTALAVNPKDERYAQFVGKPPLKLQSLNGIVELNIVSDYMIDPEFGTGVVKVTPAHSQTDWEIAQRNPEACLPAKQVIGYDLKLNHLTGKYEGLSIKEARNQMRDDLKEAGLLVYIDDNYQNRILIAERTGAPIEPLLSAQWYLKYDGMREAAMEMVKPDSVNHVQIHPESMISKFNHWMENLRDWAISRSLWWGYRLPVWYAGEVKEEIGEDGQVRELIMLWAMSNERETHDSQLNAHSSEWIPLEYNNPNHVRVQIESPGDGWRQDENVLDTWFSSGQWVYATLTKYNLMDTFFPTDVLVSAHDILENWDSRMMMFTYFKHKKQPFNDLFLTGLVLGKDGQKMSKSKGNIMDMDKIREQYGTDAVRMVYFYQNSAGASYVVNDEKLKTFRGFMNKIWNAAKFVLMNIEDLENVQSFDISEDLKLEASKKLIAHIQEVKAKVTKNIQSFEFGHATENLYHEFWHSFCDIFIEESKQYVLPKWNKETKEIESEPNPLEKSEMSAVLLYVLKEYLKMMHPFIPFVTQTIWNEVPLVEGDNRVLMYSKW